MGKPLDPSIQAAATPPVNDAAQAVLSGAFTAVGPGPAFAFYGAFNVLMWGSAVVSLATQAASANATVNSTVALTPGQGLVSARVPYGATIVAFSTTNLGGLTTVQIAGLTTTQVGGLTAGTDAAALVIGVTPDATVNLERSFDGGQTWITCGIGGGGQPASYDMGAAGIDNPVSFVVAEPERQVAYRLNCISYTSGTVNYRISATGLAAMTWGIPVG